MGPAAATGLARCMTACLRKVQGAPERAMEQPAEPWPRRGGRNGRPAGPLREGGGERMGGYSAAVGRRQRGGDGAGGAKIRRRRGPALVVPRPLPTRLALRSLNGAACRNGGRISIQTDFFESYAPSLAGAQSPPRGYAPVRVRRTGKDGVAFTRLSCPHLCVVLSSLGAGSSVTRQSRGCRAAAGGSSETRADRLGTLPAPCGRARRAARRRTGADRLGAAAGGSSETLPAPRSQTAHLPEQGREAHARPVLPGQHLPAAPERGGERGGRGKGNCGGEGREGGKRLRGAAVRDLDWEIERDCGVSSGIPQSQVEIARFRLMSRSQLRSDELD